MKIAHLEHLEMTFFTKIFYGVAFSRSVLSFGILNAAGGNIPAKTFLFDSGHTTIRPTVAVQQ